MRIAEFLVMSTNRANRRFLPVLVFIGCLLAFVAGLMVRSSPWLKLAGEATSHEEHEHETHDHEADRKSTRLNSSHIH